MVVAKTNIKIEKYGDYWRMANGRHKKTVLNNWEKERNYWPKNHIQGFITSSNFD